MNEHEHTRRPFVTMLQLMFIRLLPVPTLWKIKNAKKSSWKSCPAAFKLLAIWMFSSFTVNKSCSAL